MLILEEGRGRQLRGEVEEGRVLHLPLVLVGGDRSPVLGLLGLPPLLVRRRDLLRVDSHLSTKCLEVEMNQMMNADRVDVVDKSCLRIPCI